MSLSAFELLTGNEPSTISCACVDTLIFWHVIPHSFQTSNLMFHYSSQGCLCSTPPAPVLGGLHALSLWSNCIGCVELSSLIHFAQRHYLYPYIPPAEGSQYRNFSIKYSLLDKTTTTMWKNIPCLFFFSSFFYCMFSVLFLKHKMTNNKGNLWNFFLILGQLGQHCLAVTYLEAREVGV